jgi:hypothetical protein
MRGAVIAGLLVVVGCGKNAGGADPNASVGPGSNAPPPPAVADAAAPSAAADDHAASAAAMFDAMNYVAPDELAYSRAKAIVVYPGCGGGEGPGEHCALTGLDHAGKPVELADFVQWSKQGETDPPGRGEAIARIKAALDALDTVRMDRTPWSGTAMDVPGFGRIEWDAGGKQLVASAGDKRRAVTVTSDKGGPVNVFASPAVPVAVVQLRFNPASGGTEGYVVFIELVVVPRP